MTDLSRILFECNWDNKLLYGTKDRQVLMLIYDVNVNRIWKQFIVSGQTITCKFIVDILVNLPTILLEIAPTIDVIRRTNNEW